MNKNPPAPALANAVRLVRLIGEVREDGRVTLYPAAPLVPVPLELLRHGLAQP